MLTFEAVASDAVPMDLLLAADPSRDMIDRYLPDGDCVLAREDGRVVGEYILLKRSRVLTELMNVAVVPDRRGAGIGKALVQHAVARARSQGALSVEVATGNSSLAQLALYQRCGFRVVGVATDFFVRHYPSEIVENGIVCRDLIRLRRVM